MGMEVEEDVYRRIGVVVGSCRKCSYVERVAGGGVEVD